MAYELRESTGDDLAKILLYADDRQKQRFTKRRFFEKHPNIVLALRNDGECFLFSGPKADIMSPATTLFFCFEEKLIELEVRRLIAGNRVKIINKDKILNIEGFYQEINDALAVHGLYGGIIKEPGLQINQSQGS
jgi:hypothetical protein